MRWAGAALALALAAPYALWAVLAAVAMALMVAGPSSKLPGATPYAASAIDLVRLVGVPAGVAALRGASAWALVRPRPRILGRLAWMMAAVGVIHLAWNVPGGIVIPALFGALDLVVAGLLGWARAAHRADAQPPAHDRTATPP